MCRAGTAAWQQGMVVGGRPGGPYRRSGVVESEQDKLLQVLPLVFEGPHFGPHAQSCRRRPGRPQLFTVYVSIVLSSLGAVASNPPKSQIFCRPQPAHSGDLGVLLGLARPKRHAQPRSVPHAFCIYCGRLRSPDPPSPLLALLTSCWFAPTRALQSCPAGRSRGSLVQIFKKFPHLFSAGGKQQGR